MKRSVTVDVAGQKFTLKTDADDEYVESLARFVTEKIGEVKLGSRTFSTQALAILAALNIADDLFQERREATEFRDRVREKSQRMLTIVDPDET